MILDANQLASIRQHNDEELRKGSRATHGYPANTVQNLLHTIEALKKENATLKAKAEKQDSQEARLNAMEAQLAELRRALGLGENKGEKAAENTGEDD